MNEVPDTLKDCLQILSREAKELYLTSWVPELETIPAPLEFYRNYVSYNRPVLIKNAVKSWPALQLWKNNDFFRSVLGEKTVTVAVTPNGLADSPVGERFVMPHERSMKFSKFLDIIENPYSEKGIFYIQKQNSNLIQELPELLDHIEEEIPWATESFGKKPDAVNFWLGDRRAVTSMHKDPYENIYCVVRGYKDILLQPPSDLPWIPYKQYRPAEWSCEEGREFVIREVGGEPVPWICLDPLRPDLEAYPDYANSTQLRVRVEAGDVLYLPSFWFHHLSQSQGCIAVNYWYDMEFDSKYNYFNLLANLKHVGQLA